MAAPLTLEALEVLDAIERKGSFAAAAVALNKVPSAISYTVQKLEQDLGITLFQRQGRRSVLTTAGQHLVEQGRQLLLAASELAITTQQVATGWEPRLRIATDHLLPSDYILPLINQLYQIRPTIDIDVTQEILAGTWEALIENRADLIVGAVETPPRYKGIRSIAWQSIEMTLVAAANHPILQHQQPLTAEVIQQYRSVIVRDSSKNLTPLSRGLLNKENFIHVPSMSMKVQAHCYGLGIGYVPKNLIKKELNNGSLVELEAENAQPNTTLHLAWKISNRGQALLWMVEQLQNQPSLT